ncbi:Crp/Fnr family transcriptional regulator [Psychrosphaera sp. F3M07]|uniref:Crp/Fnr family transcriptional regulator n=1 Tax=Psychrosphaera sp. F3M07 TaxID=2841560 RepID=UPI001C07F73A|nr:Crp/Fnr family transcriptional regulator [Psychrosphaera sp. F3M07]MBU2917221.1 Crp/Fnr family transcriptional regulator [Psychrosphaera sp. F3M07]
MNFYDFLQREGIKIEKKIGDHVFRQGEIDTSLYFINSGLLKAYYLSEEGKESIKSFLSDKDIIGSLTSAYLGEPCSFGLLCLQPTKLTKISFSALREYSKKDVNIANELIDVLLQFSMKKEKREYEFLCLSAEQRFSLLVESRPNLIEKITQNDLSRYLGVTPVGLSRIKKRVYENMDLTNI